MSEKKWTKAQNEALTSRGQNLLLSAAAGSGKTAVLVERIIRQITDLNNPMNVTDLLVLTFTKSAAAEMKSRVTVALGNALAKAAKENNTTLTMHLNKQIALMTGAQFSTLDSFFISIIRQYFYLINIPPDISIISNQKELYLMKQEVLSEVLENHYAENDKNFIRCADMFAGKFRDSKLKEIILKLHNFSCSMPFPEEWLEKLSNPYTLKEHENIDTLPYTEILLKNFHYLAKGWQDSYRIMFALIEKEKALMPYTETLSEELAGVSILCDAKDWSEWKKTATKLKFGRLKSTKKNQAENIEAFEIYKEQIKSLRDDIKKKLTNIIQTYFSIDETRWIDEMRKTASIVSVLSKLTLEFSDAYKKRKLEESVMEFSDTPHYVLDILIKKREYINGKLNIELMDAAKNLQKKYKEIMLDEYQDINAVQELITSLISNGTNLFMVGDIKQSIYRFRMADHSIFLEKYNTFSKEKDSENRLIVLNKNFRSDHHLLSSINYIFRQIMHPEILELNYGDDEALYAGRLQNKCPSTYIGNNENGAISIELINKSDLKEKISQQDYEHVSNEELEARFIAEKIKNIITNKLTVTNPDGTYRIAEYKDIAVLMRSIANKAPLFLKVFREYNIPAISQTTDSFLDSIEVKILLALLQIIDNPYRDLPLLAVLRSFFVGIDEPDFAKIALAKKELNTKTWWETLPRLEKYLDTNVFKKINIFISQYNKWKKYSLSNSVSKLLQLILEDTKYISYVSGLVEGPFRKTHIESFYLIAAEFDQKEKNGLYRFLALIEKLVEEQQMPEGTSPEAQANAVQILTIHKSKGLEYPIVFLANCHKNFNEIDYRASYITHKTMGLGIHYYDEKLSAHWPTFYWYAIKEDSVRSNKAEEARLLYVAMTRAKDKLFISGVIDDLIKNLDNWTIPLIGTDKENLKTLLEAHTISTATNYLDWIMPAAMGHKTLKNAWDLVNKSSTIKNDAKEDNSVFTFKSIPAIEFLPLYLKKKYNINNTDEITAEKEKEETPLSFFENCEKDEIPEWLEKQLTWKYPYSGAAKTPVKLTATKAVMLKKEEENKWLEYENDETLLVDEIIESKESETANEFLQLPKFMEKESLITGASYGTLMHKAMELLPLSSLQSKKEIYEEIIKLQKNNSFTEEETQILLRKGKNSPIDRINNFIKSPLGKTMKNAKNVKKEMPFSILLPADEFYKECEKDEKIFIQGIIDCLIERENKIIIIDYKTDKTENEEKLRTHYKVQLQIYAKAAEQILQKEIEKIYIWSFSMNKSIEIPIK